MSTPPGGGRRLRGPHLFSNWLWGLIVLALIDQEPGEVADLGGVEPGIAHRLELGDALVENFHGSIDITGTALDERHSV